MPKTWYSLKGKTEIMKDRQKTGVSHTCPQTPPHTGLWGHKHEVWESSWKINGNRASIAS